MRTHICLHSKLPHSLAYTTGDSNALGDGIDSQAAAEFASTNAELWSNKYKPVILQAETLANLLPWRQSSTSITGANGSGSMSDGKERPLDLELEGRAMSWLSKALNNNHLTKNKKDGMNTASGGSGERNTQRSGTALNKEQQNALLMQDTVHVTFNETISSSINKNTNNDDSSKYVSYLFVAPCYFRGIGLDFELVSVYLRVFLNFVSHSMN